MVLTGRLYQPCEYYTGVQQFKRQIQLSASLYRFDVKSYRLPIIALYLLQTNVVGCVWFENVYGKIYYRYWHS